MFFSNFGPKNYEVNADMTGIRYVYRRWKTGGVGETNNLLGKKIQIKK